MENANSLHWFDYVVFFAILSPTIAIGFYYAGNRQRTIAQYFSGNQKLRIIPTILSTLVSFKSSASIVGIPVEGYFYGGQYMLSILSMVGLVMATQWVIPVIYPLKLISINRYLELRWKSKTIKYVCSALLVFRGILYMGLVAYSSSIVISVITNWSLTLVIIISSAITVILTVLGGLKAVIWTDVVLCICMFSGTTLLLIAAILNTGGLVKSWSYAWEGDRLNLFDFGFDPTIRYSFWAMLIGQSTQVFFTRSLIQTSVQRYGNVMTLEKAKKTVFLSAIGERLYTTLTVMVGVAMFSYYSSIQCDPLKQGAISSPNQLVPFFVLDNLQYPGVLGFFAASVLAAGVSTTSSYFNSSAAIVWDDFACQYFPEISTEKATKISKFIVLVIGVLSTVFGLTVPHFGGTLIQLFKSLSVFIIPVWGIFFAGVFCPWFNKKGLLVGSMCGFGLMMWIFVGQYYMDTTTHMMLPTPSGNCPSLRQNDSSLSNEFKNELWTSPANMRHLSSGLDDSTTEPYTMDPKLNDNDKVNDSGFLTWLYTISFLWYTFLGVSVFTITGSLVSLCTGRETMENIDEELVAVFYRKKKETNDKEMEALKGVGSADIKATEKN